MPTPILTTKLHIPEPRPNAVLRPRLVARLNEGLHRKLALISAPAGFGKSTLASQWAAGCRRPVAWLSLDEGDKDPVRFLAYLVAALQTIAADIGEGVLGLLQSPQPPLIESVLTALINEISAAPDSFALVLDDYHLIEAKSVDHALTFFIDHLPAKMHLVVATREDPPLPLARLRARGQLTELRTADLRFTPSEAAGFLNQVMGLNLSAEDILILETRTEGWIAGLQLAAVSMQGHQDPTGFIRSFSGSHSYVLDYLLEEVLQRQPEDIQTFLLRTSILERLCGPLCDSVLADSSVSGQEILAHLQQTNLFIVPLDNERRWYRYHHLFADLLRQRLPLSTACTAGDAGGGVAELHKRACRWYEDNHLVIDAYHHAAAAADFERATNLAELAWPEMDGNFQAATWLGWVRALPDELVRVRPVLGVAYAWALLGCGALEDGAARLRDVERQLNRAADAADKDTQSKAPGAGIIVVDEEQFRSLPASIATARAYVAQALGDVPGTVKHARKALDLLPEDDHFRHGAVAGVLGLSYWASGNLDSALRTLADCMDSLHKTGNITFAISPTFVIADIRKTQGRLREAIHAYEYSLGLVTSRDDPMPLGRADLYLGLSELHLEQGDRDAAEQHLLKSEELGEQALPDWQFRLCLAKSRLKQTQGDPDGALELLDRAQAIYYRTPLPDIRPIGALKTRVWIQQGRLVEARRWVRDAGLSPDDDLSYLQEFQHVTLARVRIAEYRSQGAQGVILGAMGLLERLLDAAEKGKRMGSVIEILVLQALGHEAQGSVHLALEPLSRALRLAEPEGYVGIFVDEGLPMARLLSESAAHGIMPNYSDKLLSAFKEDAPAMNVTSFPRPSRTRIEPLSRREHEILQLIARGLSNREISERLFLALTTVKGHNRNIFGKLQVRRRTEAVARARELGLL